MNSIWIECYDLIERGEKHVPRTGDCPRDQMTSASPGPLALADSGIYGLD